jgi:ADP-heptose:LPS heptosyltransferase
MQTKKILVIRFSSIGDIIVTTPVLRCLKSQIDCEIHFLCYSKNAHVVSSNPNIDQIISIEKLDRSSLQMLKKEKYDLIIDLHKNLKTTIIRLWLSTRYISFNKVNLEKWLFVNFKINRLPADTHLVDRYFQALSKLGIVNDGRGMDFPIPEGTALEITKHPELPKAYHVLVLAATYYTKRIPDEKCADIIRNSDLPVVFLGGKDVVDIAMDLHIKFPGKTIDFCGKLSLFASALVIKQCHTVYTSDTGLMHISAALQKKIVMIWGCTHPLFGMFPYYGNSQSKSFDMEVPKLKCRPCSKIGHQTCPNGHFYCMLEQNFTENKALDHFLKSKEI